MSIFKKICNLLAGNNADGTEAKNNPPTETIEDENEFTPDMYSATVDNYYALDLDSNLDCNTDWSAP